MVIYPIRNAIDDAGRQLVNWVAELECAEPVRRDWSARGRLDDFFPAFADWHFDWLDVADADPLDRRRARLSDGRPGPVAALELRPRHAARRRGASDGPARLERRRPGDPRRASASPTQLAARGVGADALAEYDRIRNAGDGEDRARQPQHAAGRDPARGARAIRRQAVRAHRGRRLARGARTDRRCLQAGRRPEAGRR